MDDSARAARIRDQLPVVLENVYLNTGTAGPLPIPVADAMRSQIDLELGAGRGSVKALRENQEAGENARGAVARLIHAQATEVALTHHTTEGMNVVLWGIAWQPGDDLVTTTTEHPSTLVTICNLKHRMGVQVKFVDLADSGSKFADSVQDAFTERTKLLVLSHVSFRTGSLLPIADLVVRAHAHKVPVLIDAAQSVGAIPINVNTLGVDYMALSGQKWLCGPEGTGALYLRRDLIDHLGMTFSGYRSQGSYDVSGDFTPADGATRFETGDINVPDVIGQAASIDWLERDVGLEWAYRRIAKLAEYARGKLSTLPQVRIIGPKTSAGLISFEVNDMDAEEVASRLGAQNVVVRWIDVPKCVRISVGFFNTEDEIDRLVEALANIRPGASLLDDQLGLSV